MNRAQKRTQRRIHRALKAKLEEAREHYDAVIVVNGEQAQEIQRLRAELSDRSYEVIDQ